MIVSYIRNAKKVLGMRLSAVYMVRQEVDKVSFLLGQTKDFSTSEKAVLLIDIL